MFGCAGNTSTRTMVDNDSITIHIDEDSLSSMSSMDDYDWTPEEFKIEHPDEWAVVKPAINVQQRDGDIDFTKIDTLVQSYIKQKSIVLPKEAYLRIQKIEEICQSKFDISGYDESNMGMNIADGTARLFEDYVNWLLSSEAKKTCIPCINLKEEEDMVKIAMDAFISCCDTIGYAFQGSGGWHGYSEISRIEKNFKKSMYIAVLKPQIHRSLPFLLTPKHFKAECNLRAVNYKPDEWEESPTPQKVKSLLTHFYLATNQWLEYRHGTELQITDSILKSEYSFITRTFAKELYIHLKNKFEDIGLCSASMYDECYLHLDCTDEEMLSYNYEEAYRKYLNK